MKHTIRLLSAFAGAALLAGCVTAGDYDYDRDRGRGPSYDEGTRREVSGTVESVDRVNRRIVVAEEGGDAGRDRYDRRGDERDGRYRSGDRRGREIAIYYDRGTTVEREGRRYRPQDLERGDRIQAEVEQTDAGLMIRDLQVLGDARAGEVGEPGEPNGAVEPEPIPVPGPPPSEEPREPGPPGPYDRDQRNGAPLRGIVRYVDTSAQVIDVETPAGYGPSGRPGLVRVQYDDNTAVEFQGRRCSPENLERGDRVEIDIRDLGGRRLLAEQIVVVGEGRSEGL